MSIRINCYGLSDVGHVRDANEDQFLIADMQKAMIIERTSLPMSDYTWLFGKAERRLLLVADGIGGHTSGEQASSVATAVIAQYILHTMPWFYKLKESRDDDLQEDLKRAIEDFQQFVRIPRRENPLSDALLREHSRDVRQGPEVGALAPRVAHDEKDQMHRLAIERCEFDSDSRAAQGRNELGPYRRFGVRDRRSFADGSRSQALTLKNSLGHRGHILGPEVAPLSEKLNEFPNGPLAGSRLELQSC